MSNSLLFRTLASFYESLVQNIRLVRPELLLFRFALVPYLLPALSAKERFKFHRLLFLIRAVTCPAPAGCSTSPAERNKSCTAHATAGVKNRQQKSC